MHNSNLQSMILCGGSKKEKMLIHLLLWLYDLVFWHVSTNKKLLLHNGSITAPINKAKREDQIFGGMTEQIVQKAWIKKQPQLNLYILS